MIQAWCAHHGLYSIGPVTAKVYASSLQGGKTCMEIRNSSVCNEEVYILINGKRIAHPDEIIEYLKNNVKTSI